MMEKFHYLKVGLASCSSFVGIKMLIADVYKLPIAVSLGRHRGPARRLDRRLDPAAAD